MISAREQKYLALMAGLHERSKAGTLSRKDLRYIHTMLLGDRLAAGRKMLAYLEGWVKYAKRP